MTVTHNDSGGAKRGPFPDKAFELPDGEFQKVKGREQCKRHS